MAQKVVQYQAVLQLAQTAPQLYDMPLLHRQMLDVLGIKNAAKLVPMEDDTRPRDPVTENQNILKLKPVKAFLYQDHQAHIQVHMMAMQDPQVQQALQGNPTAPAMQSALMAHVAEHIGFEYRKQMERDMGMTLPNYEMDEEIVIPKEMEIEISKRAAVASQELLQKHQQEAMQEQAQQQAQDPVVQMQMQELQIKQAEVQRKIAKDQMDAAAKEKQIQVEIERINSQKEIADANIAVKAAQDDKRNARDEEVEGFKQGMEINKLKMKLEKERKK
jgi:hypothetical protein